MSRLARGSLVLVLGLLSGCSLHTADTRTWPRKTAAPDPETSPLPPGKKTRIPDPRGPRQH